MKSSMFLKPSSKNVWMYVIYFVVIVALLIAFGKYFQITKEYYENFGDFSPYHPDKQAKVVDQILMDGRLKEYEKHTNVMVVTLIWVFLLPILFILTLHYLSILYNYLKRLYLNIKVNLKKIMK